MLKKCKTEFCYNFYVDKTKNKNQSKYCSKYCQQKNADYKYKNNHKFKRYKEFLEKGNKNCASGVSDNCVGFIHWWDTNRINCINCANHLDRYRYKKNVKGSKLSKCITPFCFNFFYGRTNQKCCTRKCNEQYNDIIKKQHIWYFLNNPRECQEKNCYDYVDERQRNSYTYCNSHLRTGTAYDKGLIVYIKDQIQICEQCNKEYKNETKTKCCSENCYIVYRNSKNRIRYHKTNKKYKLKKGYEYFYLVENEMFYKFGRSTVINKRLADHKRQGLELVFYSKAKSKKVLEYETLLKNYTSENKLRYTGNYNFTYAGRTETICKSKLKQPEVKWLVNTIMDKRKVTI